MQHCSDSASPSSKAGLAFGVEKLSCLFFVHASLCVPLVHHGLQIRRQLRGISVRIEHVHNLCFVFIGCVFVNVLQLFTRQRVVNASANRSSHADAGYRRQRKHIRVSI